MKREPVAAVVFDLLSGLLDSWTLWDNVAGSKVNGRKWRLSYLELSYGVGAWRPYEHLVIEAAERLGFPGHWGVDLVARWGELEAWPEVALVLAELRGRVKLGVVTNCSEAMGRQAAALAGEFDVVVSAERAGFYKPHPQTYQLALKELGVLPASTLFVAGSPFDLIGCASVGLPVYWHNRIGLIREDSMATPLVERRDLLGLREWL
jgi:2-haloalkanoic acid dehalogenase type II